MIGDILIYIIILMNIGNMDVIVVVFIDNIFDGIIFIDGSVLVNNIF